MKGRQRCCWCVEVEFGATVFVTDDFCSEARSTLPPYLGVELAQRYHSYELPILNREQVARANARGGLNVMMCFEGWAQYGFSPEQFLAVVEVFEAKKPSKSDSRTSKRAFGDVVATIRREFPNM